MNMNFCPNCGNKMDGDEQFCPNCGTKLAQEQPTAQTPPQSAPQYAQQPQYAAPQYAQQPQYAQPQCTQGYSNRINDPEIVARTRKNNKVGVKFMLLMLPLPIIGFPVYALATKDMSLGQALIVGAIVSAVILIFSLVAKAKRSAKNTYEATVIDKQHDTIRTNGDDQPSYTTIVRTTDGKKKVIRETSNPERSAYEYLNIGDRFRYHPHLAFPYEKYDKTKDGFVYCVCCAAKNDLSEDRCCKCGVPLLK